MRVIHRSWRPGPGGSEPPPTPPPPASTATASSLPETAVPVSSTIRPRRWRGCGSVPPELGPARPRAASPAGAPAASMWGQQGARIEVDCPSVTVHMDEGKLKQCLFNLAGTAIRYSPQGTVLMRVSVLRATRIRVDVEDTGAGIPAHLLLTLFEPFKQAPGSQSGTGLGLALVRSISERMGSTARRPASWGWGRASRCSSPPIPRRAEDQKGQAHGMPTMATMKNRTFKGSPTRTKSMYL